LIENTNLFNYEKTIYKLQYMRIEYKIGIRIFLITGFIFISLLYSWLPTSASRQSLNPTPTITGNLTTPFITVTYIEPINVRTGPSSFDYPIIGSIQPGETAPAIGRSPAGEWIQIEYLAGPQGKGWVYAPNVTLSIGALLPIIEPPPTIAPLETPTFNPTFYAAFKTDVPPTRLPTYTIPPPLTIPTYEKSKSISNGRVQTSWLILGFGLIGVVVFAFSSFRRR
jgi:hypothetical protein